MEKQSILNLFRYFDILTDLHPVLPTLFILSSFQCCIALCLTLPHTVYSASTCSSFLLKI